MKTLPLAPASTALVAIIALGLFTQPETQAATLTYEGFTGYPSSNNNLVGDNGGTGWSGAWNSTNSQGFLSTVRNSGNVLAYPGYTGSTTPAASGGNYLNLAAGFGADNPSSVFRSLDTSVGGNYDTNGYLLSPGLIGADNKTLWGSILYSNDQQPGSSTRQYQLEGGTAPYVFTLPQTATSNLLVFRIDFRPGATDTVTTFNNPNLATFNGSTGGVTSAPGDYSFTTIRLLETFVSGSNGGSEGQYDDLRFGQTLSDVAPTAVPEPSTWMLGLGGCALLVGLQQRRRRQLRG